jgi:AcrR family transcriptional regulator
VDPRISRTREVVLDATLDELAESGYDGMTIEAIAKRAGVSKATVYRHWDGKEGLVCDALHRSHEAIGPVAGDTARERIVALIEQLASKYRDGVTTRCMPALLSASDRNPAIKATYHDFAATIRRALVALVDEGIGSGEIAPVPDSELAVDALVGPVLVGRLFTAEAFDPARVAAHVEWVLPAPSGGRQPAG